MRAQIRELIRPATLLAAVLVSVSPSAAAGLPGDFVAHSNQEDHHDAHSNQETTIGLDTLPSVGPPAPVALNEDLVTGSGFRLRVAASPLVGTPLPADPGPSPDAAIGLPPASLPAPPGPPAAARRTVPAPGGWGLLVLPCLGGRRGRRRRA
jgi:hypothetical protein